MAGSAVGTKNKKNEHVTLLISIDNVINIYESNSNFFSSSN